MPDGRLRSRRWRVVGAAAVAGPAMFVVGAFLIPGSSTDTAVPFDNPLGQPGLVGDGGQGLVAVPAWRSTSPPCSAALVCVILRFRASAGSSASSCAGSPPGPPSP